ncbi:hypothetical protein CHU98_g11605 [Xylaria longipes]|nr:hypothetical protein CHU98_g11605 [Xylaria longipes]
MASQDVSGSATWSTTATIGSQNATSSDHAEVTSMTSPSTHGGSTKKSKKKKMSKKDKKKRQQEDLIG